MGVITEAFTEEVAAELCFKEQLGNLQKNVMKKERTRQPVGTFNVKFLKCHPTKGRTGTLD